MVTLQSLLQYHGLLNSISFKASVSKLIHCPSSHKLSTFALANMSGKVVFRSIASLTFSAAIHRSFSFVDAHMSIKIVFLGRFGLKVLEFGSGSPLLVYFKLFMIFKLYSLIKDTNSLENHQNLSFNIVSDIPYLDSYGDDAGESCSRGGIDESR
ncbi:hypothetical protein PHYBLDRAFT_176288 [Phycomyces blakesleeanus NRRL 1555(-)]|uniref:Uncharacterized protein n=1 Tax=Phycomyces blakesleeanus (strain ATCC 8743b / DSM 1359 / FGSC 10004 / NBRC 33097 / NRRL 1555) TaxID=763407 RepID=A0A162W7Z8_PHYB8|nr:hypothetical protein PHYBLDRAFT_72585 [Phycomyces blakesleeanus NRRL 1555(-)]XP_018283275.1 hypothetical protein PHYBLDRAFT_176288 [Phycomyces blakesleeanus NRRL 1555(-)]OAD65233.1 hypothetical protein PHYBLDRAFT_72585 [Phycomyces blakesleeanus NRRL 1555(-)]OAD65235.1 hypothetical protein PHYBLDRAFT_176288 [Phycomyces blakesleeanus NRRL 1555(-)]|eukprot:XP_018283273.1 hypothetical protein PHYBLDRAFT_72585 [Phycomyces blakesleeanus NRRL 1555(-)]